MFDTCRPWRKLLTSQAEGEISPTESSLLENHLKRCSKCRQVLAADIALKMISGLPTERLGLLQARNFDETVLAALNMTKRQTPLEIMSYWIQERRLLAEAQGKSFEFKLLLVGGGLTASAVIALLALLLFKSSALPPDVMGQRQSASINSYKTHSNPNSIKTAHKAH